MPLPMIDYVGIIQAEPLSMHFLPITCYPHLERSMESNSVFDALPRSCQEVVVSNVADDLISMITGALITTPNTPTELTQLYSV